MESNDHSPLEQDKAASTLQTEVSTATTPGPAPTPQPRSKGNGYWRWYLGAAFLAAAVVAGAVVSAGTDAPASAVETVATADSESATTAPESPVKTTVVESTTAPETILVTGEEGMLLDASVVGAAVIPSVVTVQISGTAANGENRQLGSGSGVVYDTLGHIITNDHVVAAGTSYEIVLADGRVYPADLVGTDPTTDLAVLEVTTKGLIAIAIGDSDALTVGDPAVAVGSPLGLDGGPSLTVGVISAFGREVQTDSTTVLYGMLQTDAPITQGSSGGALVDGAGQLVGITTAVGVSDVGIEGIGFATPVEVVTRVADEIIASGEASSPYIGIRGATTFAETTDGGSIPIGVIIDTVEPDTAADSAGLVEGDVISAINGDTVKTMDELIALLRRYSAGSTIEVSLDGGATVAVTLRQRPGI